MKKEQLRAILTICGHEDMDDKEFRFFKKWIKSQAEQLQKYKRGDLSKRFHARLFK